jgi:hypothetical protein
MIAEGTKTAGGAQTADAGDPRHGARRPPIPFASERGKDKGASRPIVALTGEPARARINGVSPGRSEGSGTAGLGTKSRRFVILKLISRGSVAASA